MRTRKYHVRYNIRHELKVLKSLSKDLKDGTLKRRAEEKIKELEERIALESEKKLKKRFTLL